MFSKIGQSTCSLNALVDGVGQLGGGGLILKICCPKCFESVTLIQLQHSGRAFKEPAKGQCLNCMDEQEYGLTIPANRKDLIHVIEAVTPKAETLT